jgi:hypothetical protein
MAAPVSKKASVPAPPVDFGVSGGGSVDAEGQGGSSMMLSVAAMVVALLSFGSVFMVYSSVPKPPEEVVFRKPSKVKPGAPVPMDAQSESAPKSDAAPEKPAVQPASDGEAAPAPAVPAPEPTSGSDASVKPSSAPENQ